MSQLDWKLSTKVYDINMIIVFLAKSTIIALIKLST